MIAMAGCVVSIGCGTPAARPSGTVTAKGAPVTGAEVVFTPQADDRGVRVGTGYPWPFPVATAFTVGSVVLTPRPEDWLARRPRLLQHEDRHVTQYAWLLGPFMLVL